MGLSPSDINAWGGLRLLEPVQGGHRNDVWQAKLGDRLVAVRRSGRSEESLAWEINLLDFLAGHDFVVPKVVNAEDGRLSVDGIVVQEWLAGRPPSTKDDWFQVAGELQRLHRLTVGYEQRPGCAAVHRLRHQRRSVDADLDALPNGVADELLTIFESFDSAPVAVVHGDPGAPNIRIGDDDSVGLLDWDESRVGVTWHDLSNLGVQVLGDAEHNRAQALSHAWEAANGWLVEPGYSRRRLNELRRL